MLGHPFVMAPPPEPVVGEGPVRLNYVARFVAEKDPMTFARALGRMRARPPVRFIGDGPMQSEVQAILAENGVAAEFPGWRTQPFSDFTRNDVLVLPSTWEGLPWLLLEAQARGVAAIASDISGNALALGDGSYGDVFRTGDAAHLAERLDAAVTDIAALRAKAERGRVDLPGRYGPAAFWNGLQDAMASLKEARNA
jgi:glycosyltransferase involved in cell wall biosynthesis